MQPKKKVRGEKMTYNFYDEYSIARNQFHNQQFPSEYLDDILVRLAYHSSAIAQYSSGKNFATRIV